VFSIPYDAAGETYVWSFQYKILNKLSLASSLAVSKALLKNKIKNNNKLTTDDSRTTQATELQELKRAIRTIETTMTNRTDIIHVLSLPSKEYCYSKSQNSSMSDKKNQMFLVS